MRCKITAIVLSALVLPGLGQLYLGRKARGVAIIILVNLLLLLTVFVLLKGLAPVIAAKMMSGTFNVHDVLDALHGVTGYAQLLLAGFGLLWAYSIVDLVSCRDDDTPSGSG